jgi:hypothetical protein
MARSNPKLWDKVVAQVKAGSKGGDAGEWSARKAQLAGKIYKDKGGSYTGSKTGAQKSLSEWTKQKWRTKSGKPSTIGPGATGERYLPEKAIKSLSSKEYAATSKAKREGTKAGKQFVSQPKSIAKKVKKFRD